MGVAPQNFCTQWLTCEVFVVAHPLLQRIVQHKTNCLAHTTMNMYTIEYIVRHKN